MPARDTRDDGGQTALALAESHSAILFPVLASRTPYAVERVDTARVG